MNINLLHLSSRKAVEAAWTMQQVFSPHPFPPGSHRRTSPARHRLRGSAEQKWAQDDPENIWLAKSGFGGTEYLLSGLFSEGSRRGLSYNRMAELLSWNPARRFGLLSKGDIALGFDADIALVDPHEAFTVRAADSESGQGYSPFECQKLIRNGQTEPRGGCIELGRD